MSKKKVNQEVKEEENKIVQIEATEVEESSPEETTEEVVEVKKENKILKVLKKIAPFAIGAGAVLAAFVIGKNSKDDEDIYLQKLEDEYGDGDDEDADEADTDDTEDSSDE